MQEELVEVELDVIEMYLNMIKNDTNLDNLTCSNIVSLLQKRFGIKCSEEEVFLLHEPQIYDVWYEDAYYYKNVLNL